MKIFTTIAVIGLSLSFYASSAQVGVNTAEPTRTLDVNGSLRVRSLSVSEDEQASKVVGVDQNGNFIEVQTGQNIEINDNIIESNTRTYSIDRNIEIFNGPTIHNLIVFPGGPATGSRIIRIRTTSPLTFLTGIEAAPDGTVIILYPTEGILTLLPLNLGSLPQNQILLSATSLVVPQFQTVQLFYDGNLQKWVVM